MAQAAEVALFGRLVAQVDGCKAKEKISLK